MITLEPPPLVTALALECREVGARALVVGGGVRDLLTERQPKDWDVEVYGLDRDALGELLADLGTVNAVGRSFGVYKVHRRGFEMDVSIPRRDSKAGRGHRGIRVEGDPGMTPAEAARRRDLTVNAIMVDPLTGEVLDPHRGRDDLDARLLRAVDPDTFLDDPLRALRVVQFAARLGFDVDPTLEQLCREAALDELPAERIEGEWRKLLLDGRQPSRGLALARRAGLLVRLFPEVSGADGPAVDRALDRLAAAGPPLRPLARRYAAGLATWLHRASEGAVVATLDRLWLHRLHGYPLRDQVVRAVLHWSEPLATDADLRRLSTRAEVDLALVVRWAVEDRPEALGRRERATELGVLHDAPAPLLQGRHLEALGLSPGPKMGEVLRHVYDLQIEGEVLDHDQARARASAWLREQGA